MIVSKKVDGQLVKIFGFLLVFLALCYSIAINSFKNGQFFRVKYLKSISCFLKIIFIKHPHVSKINKQLF